MLLVILSALPWLRRPEAWLATLCTRLCCPQLHHPAGARAPYLVTTAVLITLCSSGRGLKETGGSPVTAGAGCTPLLVAASAWIHGSWYSAGFAGAAILIGRILEVGDLVWRCWLLGSFLGCALTGHPWEFLFQAVRHMFGVFGHLVVNRQLEPELHQTTGRPRRCWWWRPCSCGARFHPLESARRVESIFHHDGLGLASGVKIQRFGGTGGRRPSCVGGVELQEHLSGTCLWIRDDACSSHLDWPAVVSGVYQ